MSRFTKILNSIIGLCLMAFAVLAFYLFFYQDVIPWLGPYVTIWGFAVGCTLTMATGIVILGIGLFSRRSLPYLYNDREGGSVAISRKALKNITYTAIERFDGVLEDRVKVRIVRKYGVPSYSIKAWIGTAEGDPLPSQHAAIRARIAQDLLQCTGLATARVDLIFYASAQTNKGGTTNVQ